MGGGAAAAIGPYVVPVIVGTAIVIGGIYAWEEWKSYSKGGKQNKKDTAFEPLTPAEIDKRLEEAKKAGDKALVERLKTEQKARKTRNAQKRKNKSIVCDPNASGDEEEEDFEDAEGPTEAYSE